jgi:uncharacterized protein (TIGR03437 family)
VNGQPAPLVAVTPWQVNAQLAPDLAEGPAAFQFRFADGTTSSASAADVKSVAPAIFILPSAPCPPGTATPAPSNGQPGLVLGCSANSQAAAFHANSAVPADQAHPAAAGEVLEIYGTGLGLTNPFVPARMPAPAAPPARTLTIPQVLIGNIMVQVTFAGLTPGFAGLYQVNVVVPSGLRPGQQSVQWRVVAQLFQISPQLRSSESEQVRYRASEREFRPGTYCGESNVPTYPIARMRRILLPENCPSLRGVA